jgi:hypothetical protein
LTENQIIMVEHQKEMARRDLEECMGKVKEQIMS